VKDDLVTRIEQTIRDHDILRLKGFVALEGIHSRLLVQAVGPRLNVYFDRPWKLGELRNSQLVVIGGKHINREAIEAALRG
jgi:cobalamin biosynthesis protein CobW